MRLIDADALLEVLNEYREEYDGKDANGFYNLKYCAIMEAILAIDNAPTVAAAPEVHGRWVKSICNAYSCDRCGNVIVSDIEPPDYCCHCGARMDGGEGE